jgi:dihydroorotate dehydrogenase (NAD+) catalytic subunit
MPILTTQIASLELKNPITLASGTCGFGSEFKDLLEIDTLGAIFTKAVTPEPRPGNPMPRLAETPHGLLNSIGLANPGIMGFTEDKWPWLKRRDLPILVNVAGRTEADYIEVIVALAELDRQARHDGLAGIPGIELNLSCPNVREGGISFGAKPEPFQKMIKAVRPHWPNLLIVKMTPQVSSVAELAKVAEGAGADALSLINTVPGMAIDLKTRRPKTITNTSGYSGPAIKPIAVAQVWQAASATSLPIVGIGGISCAEDVVEFLLAGASCVQIGTASFRHPGIAADILEDLKSWMEREGVASVQDLIAAVRPW